MLGHSRQLEKVSHEMQLALHIPDALGHLCSFRVIACGTVRFSKLKIVYGKRVHAMITFRLGFGCSEVIEAALSDSFMFLIRFVFVF